MIKHCVLILVFLLLTTGLFPVKIMDLKEVVKPEFIQVEGDDLFIVEMGDLSIFVYSLKTNRLKFKVGKRGEGPGEYKSWPRIVQITKDHFMAASTAKCLWYSRNGELKKEQKVPPFSYQMTPVKNNYVLRRLAFKGHIITKKLLITNSIFENPKEFYSVRTDLRRNFINDPPDTETKVVNHIFKFRVYDGKVYVVDSQKGFVIEAFDSTGKALYTIDRTKDIAPVPIGEAFKKRALEIHKILWPKDWVRFKPSSFTFYKNFPSMRGFWIDDKKIYVTTFNVNKDGYNELIVLDLKGEILVRTFLAFKSIRPYQYTGADESFTIHKGILYELVDDEKREMWELHTTDISNLK
ncbi:MAG: 6-bladed beta-propeller [bacterium]|nr:6-bladed beta-propeller [bacterium]